METAAKVAFLAATMLELDKKIAEACGKCDYPTARELCDEAQQVLSWHAELAAGAPPTDTES